MEDFQAEQAKANTPHVVLLPRLKSSGKRELFLSTARLSFKGARPGHEKAENKTFVSFSLSYTSLLIYGKSAKDKFVPGG